MSSERSMKRWLGKMGALALLWPAGLMALGAGTSASDFDTIAVGARPAGMGNAFTAAADDSNAPFWNPAGLALVSKGEIGLMHMIDIADINYDTFSVALPASRLDGWGLSG